MVALGEQHAGLFDETGFNKAKPPTLETHEPTDIVDFYHSLHTLCHTYNLPIHAFADVRKTRSICYPLVKAPLQKLTGSRLYTKLTRCFNLNNTRLKGLLDQYVVEADGWSVLKQLLRPVHSPLSDRALQPKQPLWSASKDLYIHAGQMKCYIHQENSLKRQYPPVEIANMYLNDIEEDDRYGATARAIRLKIQTYMDNGMTLPDSFHIEALAITVASHPLTPPRRPKPTTATP